MAGRIKKGDTVFVISGKDKGREGKILKVYPRSERALVDGVSLRKRHRRPRRSGEKGSVVSMPTALAASKLLPECPRCQKAVRVGFKVAGGKRRVCKKCGGEF